MEDPERKRRIKKIQKLLRLSKEALIDASREAKKIRNTKLHNSIERAINSAITAEKESID